MEHPQPHQGPPMLYQSFADLDHSRLPDVIEGISGAEDMFNEEDALLGSRINTCVTKDQKHHADVMLGLVYMMVGGVDESHDLVLPYSLPCDTDWGGPAVLDSPALGSATYCHALVHRNEGVHIGELGMQGWDNAKTWFDETPDEFVLFGKVSEESERLCGRMKLSEVDLRVLGNIKGKGKWSRDTIMDLISSSVKSPAITAFCNDLHNMEICMLFKHCNDAVNFKMR